MEDEAESSSGNLVQLKHEFPEGGLMRKAVCIWTGLIFCWALAITARAQSDFEAKYASADTNNAVIQGKVTLPSGFAAKRHVKVTLKLQNSIVSTIYTNENGEFQIMNL